MEVKTINKKTAWLATLQRGCRLYGVLKDRKACYSMLAVICRYNRIHSKENGFKIHSHIDFDAYQIEIYTKDLKV